MNNDGSTPQTPQAARSDLALADFLSEVESRYGLVDVDETLESALQARRLLAVTHRGRLILPAFQFDNGHIRVVMEELIRVASEHGYDAMSLLVFLCSPNAYVEGDACPVTLIDSPEELLDITRRDLGVQW